MAVIQRVLNEIFPRENYKRSGEKMCLHYLIALNQPLQTIKDWIERKIAHLNYKEKAHLDLTPLSVCVLKGNALVAELLLAKGADLNSGDHKGWTPLHHAAVVGNQDILNLLGKKNGRSVVLNSLKGSYLDLKNLLTIQPTPLDEEVFFLREGKRVEKQTARKFQEITHASYCPSVFISRDQLIHQWKETEESIFHGLFPALYLEERYEKCMKYPPKISLGKLESNALQGYDVFAEETIGAFQGITVYGGAFENKPTSSDYLLDCVNGKEVRNLAPMINDGFPNCMSVSLVVKGFVYSLILSIREIKAGERLCWNYGVTHEIKLARLHLELNRDELLEYASHVFKKYENLKALPNKLSLEQICDYYADREKLRYLLETPSALLYLISLSHFPLRGFTTFCMEWNEVFATLHLVPEKYGIQMSCAQMCCSIQVALSEESLKEVALEIKGFLYSWSTTLPMGLIVNYLPFFMNKLMTIGSSKGWRRFASDLNEYVSFMEALYYYSSKLPVDNDRDCLPKISAYFMKLGEEKKKEGLRNLKEHAAGVSPSKKEELEELIKSLEGK